MSKGPNRAAVELADIKAKAQVHITVIRKVSVVACVLAAALPIWMLQGVIQPLAGKTTIINAAIPIKVVLSASIVVNIAQGIIFSVRHKSFKDVRRQKDLLEQQRGLETNLEFDVG